MCSRCTPPTPAERQARGLSPLKKRGGYSANEQAVIDALDANPEGLTADGISGWLDEHKPKFDENGKLHSWGHNSTSSYLILDTAEYPGKLISDGTVIPVSRERTGLTRNGTPAREFQLAKHVSDADRAAWLDHGLSDLQKEILDKRITATEEQLVRLREKRRELDAVVAA